MNKNFEQKSANGSKMKTQVLKILKEIYELDFSKNPCPNERYLHHYFTGKFQECFPIDYSDLSKTVLHPEWATAKHGTGGNSGGKYKKEKKEYVINNDSDGNTGWIDFAFGKIEKTHGIENPFLGIEFKFNRGWNFQSIVFDYMKLMDKTNNLEAAISFSIIYRDEKSNGLSGDLTTEKINETVDALKNRLKDGRLSDRPFLFWIIEIAPHANGDKKRAWYCNDLGKGFEECNDADKINFKTV